MRFLTTYAVRADLVDHDGSPVSSNEVWEKLDGLSCYSDTVLNYADPPFSDNTLFRGGYPRLVFDSRHLLIVVDIDHQNRLTAAELRVLREDLKGQLTDGIGAGCFDALTKTTGIAVRISFPLKVKLERSEGLAWRPKSSTEKGNLQRIAAVSRLVEKVDSSAPPTRISKGTSRTKGTAPSPKKPNLKPLFRLLAKPERDQLIDEIKSQLLACGNDLSTVVDGELPYANFKDPKLLRLLLDAGLPSEVVDEKGHHLLVQCAVEPRCIELLVKQGVNVNRICDCHDATALIRAARLGKRKSVEVLLSHKADPTIKNSAGQTAAQMVDKHSRDRQTIIDLLQA